MVLPLPIAATRDHFGAAMSSPLWPSWNFWLTYADRYWTGQAAEVTAGMATRTTRPSAMTRMILGIDVTGTLTRYPDSFLPGGQQGVPGPAMAAMDAAASGRERGGEVGGGWGAWPAGAAGARRRRAAWAHRIGCAGT